MTTSALKEQDWRILLKSIRQKQCILLLGPDVAVDPEGAAGKPLAMRLAGQLAQELEEAGKGGDLVRPSDLAHVAQIYEREMPKRRPGLELAVEDFYLPYRRKTTPLHCDLAALPLALGISTTPEGFLRNAIEQTPGKEAVYDFYHFKPNPKRGQRAPATSPSGIDPEKRPLIYDLYGSLEETDSLVLSENDLLDFLVSVTRQTPPLHPYLTSQFSDPSVSFLFLGFGFRQWYMRILLHVLKASGHQSPSLALEDGAFFTLPDHHETSLFFQSGHLIEFRQLPADFASELRQRYEVDAAQRRQSKVIIAQLPADAPVVFLCHENRDKPAAEDLARDLGTRGIKVWLDKQSLRGGDNWEKLIPDVIAKQTDYFVVLQSPRMLDKAEGYFKKEIHFALERQIGFGDFRFVIPVVLEPHRDLPLRDLAWYHGIDLTAPAGVDALAQAIHEDWQRRPSTKAA